MLLLQLQLLLLLLLLLLFVAAPSAGSGTPFCSSAEDFSTPRRPLDVHVGAMDAPWYVLSADFVGLPPAGRPRRARDGNRAVYY